MKKLKYTGFVACVLLCLVILTGCGKTPDKFLKLHEKNGFEEVLKSKDSVDISMDYITPAGEKSSRSFYMEKSKNSYNIYEELSNSEKVYFFDENVFYQKYMICYGDAGYKDIIAPYLQIKQGFTGFNLGTFLYENVNPYYEEMWYFAESFGGTDNVEEKDGITNHRITIEDNEQLKTILDREGYKDIKTVYVSFSVDKDGLLTGTSLSFANTNGETKEIFNKTYTYNTNKDCFDNWKETLLTKNVHQFTIYRDYQTENESSRKVQVPEGVNVILTSKNGDLSFYYDSFCTMPVAKSAILSLKGDSFVFSEKGESTTKGGVFGIVQNKSLIFDNAYPGLTGKLSYIQSYLDTFFYKDYDKEKIEEAMIRSIFANLDDKYAEYYTPEQYKKMLEDDAGAYVGIGVTVSKINDEFIISKIYEGGPSEKAGVKPGDKIVAVDKKSIEGMELSEIVSLIKGDAGTTVDIDVIRGDKTLTITVTRETIESNTVYYEMKENNIGYIEISNFEKITVEQFKAALEYMKENNAKGIIFDLRENPGGLMTSVSKMLDMIVAEGELFSSKTKITNEEKVMAVKENTILTVPFVCLVNKNSASAAELFTGCLKENNLAKVVGEKTYGKGIIQNTFGLPDGSGIKFTVGEYYIPGGKNIHEVGIEPDVLVSLPSGVGKISRTKENDTQYKKAVEVIDGMINN